MYKILGIFFTIFIFVGCSSKNQPVQIEPQKQTAQYSDKLYGISQTPATYMQYLPNIDHRGLIQKDEFFNKRYFKPWHIPKLSPPKSEAMWGFSYQQKETFGMNYQPLDDTWYETQKSNANFDQYNHLRKKGIMLKNTNMRVFPTKKPIFYDPKEAGEGFPFDYNQVSLIYINTPIIISHLSRDKAWAFVESNFTTGWVPINTIAYLDSKRRKIFENENYMVATTDNFPLYDDGEFIEYIKIGTIFPKSNKKLFIVTRDKGLNGKLTFVQTKHVSSKPLAFSEENIVHIMNELKNEPYGWGGLLDTRDCSSMTRDFFSLFGIYLERNSYGQTFNGQYVSFNNLTNEQKKQTIVEIGKPFRTLIYLKGHIMLYVGSFDNEPILFHQFWGIQTKDEKGNEGREIIGRTIFSTLDLGSTLPNANPEASLIEKAKGMIILNI